MLNKHFIRRMVLAGVLLLLLAMPVFVQAQNYNATVGLVTTLNILSGPGNRYRVITGVGRDTPLELIGRNADGSWLQTYTPNRVDIGWVNADYIIANIDVFSLPQTAPTGRNNAFVLTSVLNLRAGPGANFDVIRQLVGGDVMDVIGRNAGNSWVEVVLPDGTQGWVSTRYVATSLPVTSYLQTSPTGITTPPYQQPVPTGNEMVGFVTAYPNLIVRLGPGRVYDRVASVRQGEGVYLRGRNTPGTWLLVQIASGEIGWVSAIYIRTEYPIFELPVIGIS